MTQHAHASNRTGEYLFVMPALLLMIGVFKPLFGDVNAVSVMSAGYFGNWPFQVASGAVYAVALAVFYFRPAAFTQLWAQNKWLLVFSLFILISPLWSDSPWVAFRRALALTGTTVFAFYLVLRRAAGAVRRQPLRSHGAGRCACSVLAVGGKPERTGRSHGVWYTGGGDGLPRRPGGDPGKWPFLQEVY